MLALCELLVARGIIREKIVLCRLPVGHTHEDIDAVFALIWERLKSDFVFSPQQYKMLILQALRKKALLQEVVDVFVVPNFSSLFKNHINKGFERAFKTQWTQHEWEFTRVNTMVKHLFLQGIPVRTR